MNNGGEEYMRFWGDQIQHSWAWQYVRAPDELSDDTTFLCHYSLDRKTRSLQSSSSTVICPHVAGYLIGGVFLEATDRLSHISLMSPVTRG